MPSVAMATVVKSRKINVDPRDRDMMSPPHTHTHRGYIGSRFYNVSDRSLAAEETGLSSFFTQSALHQFDFPPEGNKCVPGPVIVHSAAIITKRCRILLPGIISPKCFDRLQHKSPEKVHWQSSLFVHLNLTGYYNMCVQECTVFYSY